MRKILIIITIFIVSKYSVRAQNSYSLDFDGEGDYVEIIDESAMIANADQMTLSGWVYPRGPNADSWTQFDGFFGFRNNNDADFYLLQLGAYKVEGRLRVSGGGEFTIITAENSIISETWHHLALTYNGSNIILYIDGIEAGSTEASGQITNEFVSLKIGSLVFDNTNFDLDGQVDEVSLWNLALTEQEIQNYMYAEPTGEEGLLGYWNFNEGSGETANDASGNENHGSIYGAAWSEDVPFSSTTAWYVTTTGSNSTGDGSEENPFNTIQHGLNSAYNGDTVLVAEGTYSENVLWPAKNGITLIGSGEEDCIIDGGSLASVMRFEEDLGGIIDTTTLIRGFTITNGYAQGGYPQNNGGGIYCFESSPTLMNVTITGNSSFTGGGIYCWSNSNPLLKDVTITGNSTDLYGGGIYCYESSPDLSDVTITGNSASDAGGGVYCYNNSGPTLTNVTISDNMASDAGGGFYCASFSGPSLMNSISWNNFPQEIYFFGFHEPCSITVSFSDIQGGEAEIETNGNGTVYWEEGNIDSDPLFCNPGNGDYSLAENSPCFETGENGANMGATSIGCGAMDVDNNVTPGLFILHQNYPNPFNPTTTIQYELPENSFVNIRIYDLKGRLVNTLVSKDQTAGYKSIKWAGVDDKGKPVSAELYLYTIEAGDFRQTKKMVLLK